MKHSKGLDGPGGLGKIAGNGTKSYRRAISMVSYHQEHRFCEHCKGVRTHYKRATDHTLHLLLTICTVGVWAIVWLFSATSYRPWSCSDCGKKGLPRIQANALVACAIVILIALISIINTLLR